MVLWLIETEIRYKCSYDCSSRTPSLTKQDSEELISTVTEFWFFLLWSLRKKTVLTSNMHPSHAFYVTYVQKGAEKGCFHLLWGPVVEGGDGSSGWPCLCSQKKKEQHEYFRKCCMFLMSLCLAWKGSS